jgi:hypothetical protein
MVVIRAVDVPTYVGDEMLGVSSDWLCVLAEHMNLYQEFESSIVARVGSVGRMSEYLSVG